MAAVMAVLTVATIAFAATTDRELTFAESDETVQSEVTVQSSGTVQPMMTRQQLRVHAETGPPDGVEPAQRQLRIHQNDDRGTMQGQRGTFIQGQHGNSAGRGMGAGSACTNADGPCTNR